MDGKNVFLNEHINVINSAKAGSGLSQAYDEMEMAKRNEVSLLKNQMEAMVKANKELELQNETLKKQLKEMRNSGWWQIVFGAATLIASIVAIFISILK